MGGGARREAIDRLIDAGRPDLARTLAGDDRGLLLALADRLDADANAETSADADPAAATAAAEIAADARASADRLLRDRAAGPDAAPDALAALAERRLSDGDAPGAVDLLRRALARDYGRVDWRLRLARALAGSGRPAEALAEAKVGLRLRPQSAEARKLVGDLSIVRRASVGSGDGGATKPAVP